MMSFILAVGLYSQQIGQFFDLPSGVPLSASLYNTPGSDPSNVSNGWYTAEMEEDGYEAWTTTLGMEQDTLTLSQVWSPEWSVVNISPTPSDFFMLKDWEVVKIGDDDSTSLTWNMWVDGYLTPEEYASGIVRRKVYKCSAARRKHYSPTGRYIPRSPRLTPDVYAGVNSTFEGFFERQYYAGQGQSNMWNVAQFGPRADFKRFWFDPYWMRTGGTQGSERYTNNGWDYSTNRTVTTRRLVDYDAINSLAGFLKTTICKDNGWRLCEPRRPGWIESSEGTSVDPHSCWWATTDSKFFDGLRIVPSFSWVANPMTYADWSKCSQTLQILNDDDVYEGRRVSDFPTDKIMSTLSFGQQIEDWNWEDAKPDLIDDVAFGDLITTNFPNADPFAITNGTRRLFSDRLCCMNQLLSLLDRTYHVPQIDYPTEGTNTTYYNQMLNGGITTSGTPIYEDGHYYLNAFGNISWSSPVSTNWASSFYSQSSGAAIHNAISTTRTEDDTTVGLSQQYPAPFTPEYGIEVELVESARTQGLVINEGDTVWFAIEFSRVTDRGVFAKYYVSNETTYGYYEGEIKVLDPITNFIQVAVHYKYERGYDYTRTYGDINLGPTQPGWQAGDRLKSAKMGSVVGVHAKHGNFTDDISSVMPWSNTRSSAEYKSNESAYNSRASLLHDAQIDMGIGGSRFITLYGVNPTRWDIIIPIGGDFYRVRNSIGLESAKLTYGAEYVCVAYGTWNDGRFNVSSYESWPPTGGDYSTEWRPICSPYIYGAMITKGYPEQQETEGLRTDSKIGIVTRVDWNWKTLKRGND